MSRTKKYEKPKVSVDWGDLFPLETYEGKKEKSVKKSKAKKVSSPKKVKKGK